MILEVFEQGSPRNARCHSDIRQSNRSVQMCFDEVDGALHITWRDFVFQMLQSGGVVVWLSKHQSCSEELLVRTQHDRAHSPWSCLVQFGDDEMHQTTKSACVCRREI